MVEIQRITKLTTAIMDELNRVVIGKEDLKKALIIALLAGGHVLIEGLPGTGKTLLAKSFAKIIGGEFKRIQFTPDLLPADITGFTAYYPDGTSKFHPGPIFANVILADELNRATPRTQSALLEAMQEKQVSIEGTTYKLPEPFIVIASQLPYGYEGTYPLTEIQADRFMLRVWSDNPPAHEEKEIIGKIDEIEAGNIQTITAPEEIIAAREELKTIHVSDPVKEYIISMVNYLRRHPDLAVTPSPRGSIALYKASRALAALKGRSYVTPDDIKELAPLTLEHRIRVKAEAEIEGITPKNIIEGMLKEVEVPK